MHSGNILHSLKKLSRSEFVAIRKPIDINRVRVECFGFGGDWIVGGKICCEGAVREVVVWVVEVYFG